MFPKLILLVFLLQSSASFSTEIFKWIDDQGHVHYGNHVPAIYKSRAKLANLNDTTPSTHPRPKRSAAHGAPKLETPAASEATPAQAASPKESACEAAQRKYRESEACFAPYRRVKDGVRPEAYQHCTEMKEPPPC